jgi:hypothetical protein
VYLNPGESLIEISQISLFIAYCILFGFELVFSLSKSTHDESQGEFFSTASIHDPRSERLANVSP